MLTFSPVKAAIQIVVTLVLVHSSVGFFDDGINVRIALTGFDAVGYRKTLNKLSTPFCREPV